MKASDARTAKTLADLDGVIAKLDASCRSDIKKVRASLTGRLQTIKSNLETVGSQARRGVEAELASAVLTQDVGVLRDHLIAADARLDAARASQSEEVAGLYRELAAVATAVDERLAAEADIRRSAISDAAAQLGARIDRVEGETAAAITGLGDKIVASSEATADRLLADVDARLADVLTTAELESHLLRQRERSAEMIEARLEAHAAAQDRPTDVAASISSHLDAELPVRLDAHLSGRFSEDAVARERMATLTARLEDLERQIADMSTDGSAVHLPGAQIVREASNAQTQYVPAPAAPAPTPLSHEGPDPSSVDAPVVQEVPKPAVQPQYVKGQGPVEFVPQAMGSSDSVQPPATAFDPRSALAPIPMPNASPAAMAVPSPMAMIRSDVPQPDAPMPTYGSAPGAYAVPDADLPYADPGYGDDIIRRADEQTGDRFKGLKALKGLKGRGKSGGAVDETDDGAAAPGIDPKLKIAGLAVAVGAIGYLALGGMGKGSDKMDLQAGDPASQLQTDLDAGQMADMDVGPSVETLDAIGDYADNRALPVAPDGATTLEASAAAGDPVAQLQLGLMRLDAGDSEAGIRMIRASADQGQPAAQYRLGKAYETGQGVTRDSDTARRLIELAATNGNRIAMHDLAIYYADGQGGVPADMKTAANWFAKAAERGVVDSQYNLGVLHETGQGVPISLTDAYVWYAVAGSQGDQVSASRVPVVAKLLSPEDLARAEARVADFTPARVDEAANGIFRNLPWAQEVGTPSSVAIADTQLVLSVQQALNAAGFDTGTPDGAIGPRTRQAIREFQRTRALDVTGEVDAGLLQALTSA